MGKTILRKAETGKEEQFSKDISKDALIEEIKRELGCEYISDLRFSYNDHAKIYLKNVDVGKYPLDTLNAAITYIFKLQKPFENKEGITSFIEQEKKLLKKN